MHVKHFAVLSLIYGIATAHATDTDVVARMGNVTITVQDVRNMLRETPTAAGNVQDLERLVRLNAIRTNLAAQARKEGFDKQPSVAARLSRAADQALVSAYMNKVAQPPTDYPSEKLLQETYEAGKAKLTAPRRYHLSQIYLPGTDEQARKLAEDTYAAVMGKGADFAAIARKSSKHVASAAEGGDMGWVTEADMVPAIRQAVTGLVIGGTSRPINGGEGFHIIRLTERKEAGVLPYEEVKVALVQSLRMRKAAELESAYLDALLAKTPLAINGIALEGINSGKDSN